MEKRSNLDFNDVFSTLQQNLLDMGLRNNLLNFKEVARTIPIVDIDLTDLYNSLVSNRNKLSFLPKSSGEQEDETWYVPVETDQQEELQLQTTLSEKDLQKRLFSLFQYYRTSVQDLGYNNLFLALGFVEWTQQKDNSAHLAPLILVPVELSRRSVGSPFKLHWTGEDVSLNLSLKHKLQDQGVYLPERENIESQNDLVEYINDVKRQIEIKDGWTVSDKVYVSTFSFKKFVMFKDLTLENWSENINNSEIGRLFGLSEVESFDSFNIKKIDEELNPLEVYNVVDADSSQIAVIEDAKKGHSLVVEGPPGTGKSQTIVNLISELLANNKKILFVSEKMAALDVVKKRMDTIGLGDYCLELHSNKTRKGAFLDDLNNSLIQDKIEVKEYEDYDKLKQSIQTLNDYRELIRTKYGNTNLSIYDLIGMYEYKYQELEQLGQKVYKFNLPNLKEFTSQKRTEIISNIDAIAEIYNLIYPIKNNPWNYTNINYISPDEVDNINSKSSEIDVNMRNIVDDIEKFSQITGIKKPTNYSGIKKFIQQGKLLLSDQDYQSDETKLKEIVNAVQEYQNNYSNSTIDITKIDIGPIKERFDELIIQVNSLEISYDIMFHLEVQVLLSQLKEANRLKNESPVKQALNDPDIHQKFYQFRSNKDSFTKFMNKDYKRSKNELKSYYLQDVNDETITKDFDNLLKWDNDVRSVRNKVIPYAINQNISEEKLIYVLERLVGVFDEVNEINHKISKLYNKEYFKTLDELKSKIDSLNNQKELKNYIDENNTLAKSYFKSWDNVNTDFTQLVSEYDNISKFAKNDNQTVLNVDEDTKRELQFSINNLETASNELIEDYEYLNSVLHFKDKLSKRNINSLRIQEFNELIQGISENILSLSNWSQFNTYCSQFNDKYTKELINLIKQDKVKSEAIVPLFEYNFANNILKEVFDKSEVLKNFNSNIYEKNIKQFKELDLETINLNRYRVKQILDAKRPNIAGSIIPTSQLGILVHEMNKKRNHKSIRQVLNECPDTVTDIKPCLLMSPLSIAQYLDTKTYESYFDYVIFDEASQVKIEDAIGALLRGKHYIIMGDTKQLPPTAFFDVETNVESQEAEDMHVQDVESILHFCKSVLPYRMLKCHYRSRHESLIAVSNLEFYNNDLFIYPSPMRDSKELGLKLQYNPNNVYDKGKTRQNIGEAQEVVQYALEHFGRYGFTKSLGIGTFSVAQKNAILEELEHRLQENPELDPYFNTTGDKSFFVKNIENIQGDERDVMLISVGYGFDNEHNLSISFGPLNNEGGERRLNVLTTRAKEKCVVFCNFKSADMHLSPRTPKGVQVLKTYLYYAEHGKFPSDYVDEEGFDSEFEESVYNFLTHKGFNVEKRVGCAGYRIDLAVYNPSNDDEYVLAIECDGSEYNNYSSARERDRIRQNILEGLGWNFYRIWSTDWYHNRESAKQKLLVAVNKAIKQKNESSIKSLDQIDGVNSNIENKVIKQKNESNIDAIKNNIESNNQVQDNELSQQENNILEDKPNKSKDEFAQIFEVLDEVEGPPKIRDISEIRPSSNKNNNTTDNKNEQPKPKIIQNTTNQTLNEDKTENKENKEQTEAILEEDKQETQKEEGITDKIQSKIEVKKVEKTEATTENQYIYYENEIETEDFYSIPETQVIKIIEDIIQTEAPIHRNEIYNRLKTVYNVKATKKFKTRIDTMINTLLQTSHEIYVKNNYYYIFKKDVTVRKRNKPNIDYISDDEIVEAINQVLILNSSVKINQLSKEVSKLFGFKSLSAKTSNKINEVISYLRFSGKLSIDDSSIVTITDNT